MDIQQELDKILDRYYRSFHHKDHHEEENNEHDVLMDIFGITPEQKRENRQYWGRELGLCWQLLVTKTASLHCPDYQPAKRFGKDEPVDLFIGKDAIDTKYRIGSGDSGTLKKFKENGKMLREEGYNPVILILRNDNLPAAIQSFIVGQWDIRTGEDCFEYIKNKTSFDLYAFLSAKTGTKRTASS